MGFHIVARVHMCEQELLAFHRITAHKSDCKNFDKYSKALSTE